MGSGPSRQKWTNPKHPQMENNSFARDSDEDVVSFNPDDHDDIPSTDSESDLSIPPFDADKLLHTDEARTLAREYFAYGPEGDTSELNLESIQDLVKRIVDHIKPFTDLHYEELHFMLAMLGDDERIFIEMWGEIADYLADIKFLALSKEMLDHYTEKDCIQLHSMTAWMPLFELLSLIWTFAHFSDRFCEAVCDAGIIGLLTKNIKAIPLEDYTGNKRKRFLVLASLSIIQNVSKSSADYGELFEKHKVKEVVFSVLDTDDVEIKSEVIKILSRMLKEDENKQFTDAGVITFMVNEVKESLKDEQSRSNAPEVVEVLGNIAVNDDNKLKIVENGLLPCLVEMLEYNDPKGQTAAARTLWTLSFNQEVKQHIIDEPRCVATLETLSKSSDTGVKKMARGALWKIKEDHNKKDVIQLEQRDKGHIFLSYNHEHQSAVLKVKERLQADGHKVWVDVDNMGGSTMEAMAHAVEQAAVVLVCLSEKYKLSPNCRSEAEYTFQLKKPIVPLMMQRYYKPDGWLGFICGAKMYINFDGKFEFDYAFSLLNKEINRHLLPAEDSVDSGKLSITSKPQHHDKISKAPTHGKGDTTTPHRHHSAGELYVKWSTEEVQQWVEDKQLQTCSQVLNGFDGEMLQKLCNIKSEAPEFFYKYLTTDEKLNLVNVVQLVKEMDRLS